MPYGINLKKEWGNVIDVRYFIKMQTNNEGLQGSVKNKEDSGCFYIEGMRLGNEDELTSTSRYIDLGS